MSVIGNSRFSILRIVEDDYLPKPSTPKNGKPNNKEPPKKPNSNSNSSKTKTQPPNGQRAPKKKFTPISSDTNGKKKEKHMLQALRLSEITTKNEKKPAVQGNTDNFFSNNFEPFHLRCNLKNIMKRKPNASQETSDCIQSKITVSESPDTANEECAPKIDRSETASPRDSLNNAHLLSTLESRDKEISELKNEVEELKGELLRVKNRNKKLCNIIGQGELKEKAQIIAEAEKLREVQAELTAEVALLHAQLEQLKSKGAVGKLETKKEKNLKKEKHGKFNSQEKKRSNSEKEM